MMPQSVPDQDILNTGDLDFTIVLDCAGDCPPAGKFTAHMKADLSLVDIDKVFSEDRGNLVRGTVDADNQKMPLSFIAPWAELVDFVGPYTVDLYYVRDEATEPVMRTTFTFERGA